MCLGETKQFTGRVNRVHIQSVVTTLIMQYNNVTVQALKDAFWTAKERVFHADSRPKNKGPIHALCLQLFAKGIIHLDISNHTKIGTETIMDKDVSIVSGFDRAEPIESEKDDLRCLCVVFTRARTVFAVGGKMDSSRLHSAASTASKPLVSCSVLVRLDADAAAAMMFGDDMVVHYV